MLPGHRTPESRLGEMFPCTLLYCLYFFKGIYYFPNDFWRIHSVGYTEEFDINHFPSNGPEHPEEYRCSTTLQEDHGWDERTNWQGTFRPTPWSPSQFSEINLMKINRTNEMKLSSYLPRPDIDAVGFHPMPRRVFSSWYSDPRNQIECNAYLHNSFSDIFFSFKTLPLCS